MSAVIPFPSRPPIDAQGVSSGLAALDEAVARLRAQRHLLRDTRVRIEELVGRMSDLLDELDGDPDGEDGDERDCSWPKCLGRGWPVVDVMHEYAEDCDRAHPCEDDNAIAGLAGIAEQCG